MPGETLEGNFSRIMAGILRFARVDEFGGMEIPRPTQAELGWGTQILAVLESFDRKGGEWESTLTPPLFL
jgi:hypothetical protein